MCKSLQKFKPGWNKNVTRGKDRRTAKGRGKRYRYVGGHYMLNCFMLSSLSCLMLFVLDYVSSRCTLELRFAIYQRAVGLSSQASSVDVFSIGWLTRHLFKLILSQQWMTSLSQPPYTNHTSNSAILSNNYVLLLSDLCAYIQVKKMA